jgi:hypothetical protein
MKKVILIAICLALVIAGLLVRHGSSGIAALPEEQVELTKVLEGMTFKVMLDGRVYRVDERIGRWHYHETVYDPVAMEASYLTEGNTVYRLDADIGQRFQVRRQFTEGFEDLAPGRVGLRQLIGAERGWGSVTLQSPSSPEVADYVALRSRILEQGEDFADAVVAPDDQRSHSGSASLFCRSPAKPRQMITCKASLSTPLIYFRKGDDFWFRGWFYAASSRPSSLMDLECEFLQHHGGIRLLIDASGMLLVELKALDKPKYRQASNSAVQFPLDQWVEIRVHFQLNDSDQGVIQVWQDNQLLIDTRGITLPLPRAIYNSLEIGISTHSYGDKESLLWVDDIAISDQPLPSQLNDR